WVASLHRHLTDHGGGRVRQVIVDPLLAFDEDYGTLVVSHRWPSLTRTFVDAVHRRNRRLLGVFDPDEPAGREFLVSLGVDRSLPSDASMAEIVDAFNALEPQVRNPVLSVAALEVAVDGGRLATSNGDGSRRSRRGAGGDPRGQAPLSWRSRSRPRCGCDGSTPCSSTPMRSSRRSRSAWGCRSSRTSGAPSSPSSTGWATSTSRSCGPLARSRC